MRIRCNVMMYHDSCMSESEQSISSSHRETRAGPGLSIGNNMEVLYVVSTESYCLPALAGDE